MSGMFRRRWRISPLFTPDAVQVQAMGVGGRLTGFLAPGNVSVLARLSGALFLF